MLCVRLFLISSVIMLALDALWLNYIGKPFYIHHLGNFFQKTPDGIHINYAAAAIVYVCLVIGIMIFVHPQSDGSVLKAFLLGGLFGFICYGIYNFTNLAVVAGWPLRICFIDTAWGTFLCALTSSLAQWLK